MSSMLFASFNQDASCIALGTESGVRIFIVDPLRKCFEKAGSIGIVQMLYSTSLLALVGSGQEASFSPRRLQLHNSAEGTTICELNFTSSILNVLLSRKRLVVTLEYKIHIFDISTMKIVRTIETKRNSRGLCAISMDASAADLIQAGSGTGIGSSPASSAGTPPSGSSASPSSASPSSASTGGSVRTLVDRPQYLAYPFGPDSGDIVLCDCMTGEVINVIQAHKSSVFIFAFSQDGTRLATASQKGTVIRVFAIPSGELICTLRRGSYSATIYSIAFNSDSTLVSVSSSNGTVHVFKLPQYEVGQKTKSKTVGSLTDAISNMWDSVRDFAHAKYKPTTNDNRNICAFAPSTPGSNQDIQICNVVSFDGFLHRFAVDLQQPGEMKLLSSDRLL